MKTKSEELFERFLEAHNVPFEKIKVDTTHRPDYSVSIADRKLVFELKELAEDEKFGVVTNPAYPDIKSHSRTPGDHVRRRIEGSKKQIQYGAKQGLPSVLLIYNKLDTEFQMFGTEDMDFTTAMYGEQTVLLKNTGEASEIFSGKNRLLQKNKNTSFSAVGRLCDRGGETTVTLFENVFSAVKMPFELLPPCFEAKRVKFQCPNPDCKHELDWEVLHGQVSLQCPKCGQIAHVNVDDRDSIAKAKEIQD